MMTLTRHLVQAAKKSKRDTAVVMGVSFCFFVAWIKKEKRERETKNNKHKWFITVVNSLTERNKQHRRARKDKRYVTVVKSLNGGNGLSLPLVSAKSRKQKRKRCSAIFPE